MNSLRQLEKLGQSVWLDSLERDLISRGGLKPLIDEDGLSGISSNTGTLERAVSEGKYDEAIGRMRRDSPSLAGTGLLETIAVEDAQMAADALRETYERTGASDGYVSIGLSPHVAYEVQETVAEAHRLWESVDRPNLMIQVPAVSEGLQSIEQLVADGINVNATLIFTAIQYHDVAQAYLRGIERNREPHKVGSVASFMVSPIDVAVDRALEEVGSEEALGLRGKAAIAMARLVYRRFQAIFFGREFEKLRRRGVRLEKLLWAGTADQNPSYSDVTYVEGLIAPDTINCMPPETLATFRLHGRARVRLGLAETELEARDVLGKLQAMGIAVRSIGQELTQEWVDYLAESYREVLRALERRGQLIETSVA
jgi:transaldolase